MIDDKILKEFGSIQALHLFLREKINDGEEISKGKSPNEQSKEQKKDEAPEKPDPVGDAEAEAPESEPAPEMSGPEGGAEMAAGDEPVVDPVSTPGSQVQMGGIPHDEKDDKVIDNPDAVEIKISGKKNKINKRPSVDVSQVR